MILSNSHLLFYKTFKHYESTIMNKHQVNEASSCRDKIRMYLRISSVGIAVTRRGVPVLCSSNLTTIGELPRRGMRLSQRSLLSSGEYFCVLFVLLVNSWLIYYFLIVNFYELIVALIEWHIFKNIVFEINRPIILSKTFSKMITENLVLFFKAN